MQQVVLKWIVVLHGVARVQSVQQLYRFNVRKDLRSLDVVPIRYNGR
jgi:hypothetical protein